MKPVLKRFPPGDRWIPYENESDEVLFSSLTEGLDWIYKQTNSKKFVVNAETGIIFIDMNTEPPTQSKYSIYGE